MPGRYDCSLGKKASVIMQLSLSERSRFLDLLGEKSWFQEQKCKLFYICLEEMGADVMNIAIRSIKGKRILCRSSG